MQINLSEWNRKSVGIEKKSTSTSRVSLNQESYHLANNKQKVFQLNRNKLISLCRLVFEISDVPVHLGMEA